MCMLYLVRRHTTWTQHNIAFSSHTANSLLFSSKPLVFLFRYINLVLHHRRTLRKFGTQLRLDTLKAEQEKSGFLGMHMGLLDNPFRPTRILQRHKTNY